VDLLLRPIGTIRSPFHEKSEAPRQAIVAAETTGSIEILPEHEDALSDLAGFDRIWILFWFHLAPSEDDRATRGKVQPPRSTVRRGVFATRTPHRPNPIGMSAVRLLRVEGRVLHIEGIDFVDGTPVIDIKPYIPYADAFPDAHAGWLDDERKAAGPEPWTVTFTPAAEERVAWIAETDRDDLRERIAQSLVLGPQPHAYRRIKKLDDGTSVLAVKEWRVPFHAEQTRRIVVDMIASGYRERDLVMGKEPAHDVHRAFVERFGQIG